MSFLRRENTHLGETASALQHTESLMVKGLRKLCAEYPLFVVIRLCTSNQRVANYFNKLDQEVEFALDVLCNLEAEARQVKAVSPSLNYAHSYSCTWDRFHTRGRYQSLDHCRWNTRCKDLIRFQMCLFSFMIAAASTQKKQYPGAGSAGFLSIGYECASRPPSTWCHIQYQKALLHCETKESDFT